MIRKISTIVLTVVIIVTGVIAFVNLHYWEGSVRIFRLNSDQSAFRENGRGRGGFREGGREFRTNGFDRDGDFRGRQQLPDSLRGLSGEGRNFRALPDSIQRERESGEFRGDRGNFRGSPDFGRRGGGFHGGNRISLGKVTGFLAVFALFTLVAIVADKGLQRYRIRSKC